jgi:undecaprenyl pyrophosphate phosphatase UppP
MTIVQAALIGAACQRAAYLSLRFLMRYFENNRLTPFARYCEIAGVLTFGYFAARTFHLLPQRFERVGPWRWGR